MLNALRMADYRSYRETAAFDYLREIGYDTSGDLLYPDLVFSLPKEHLPIAQKPASKPLVVGLGLINYYGWRHDPGLGENIHQEYFSKIKQLATWLFARGYTIRVLSGDTTDSWPVQEFVEFVNKHGDVDWKDKLIVEEIPDVNGLFRQIAQTDLVIASRFHNVLCALMMERPVISLGYHEKNINLMTEMGLEKYCQHIEQFTFDKLVEQFECYASEMEQAIQQIHNKNEQYRKLLDEQYRIVLFDEDIKFTNTNRSNE
jgi:polysaccharide pyruvyl transferase WcaK-like protein